MGALVFNLQRWGGSGSCDWPPENLFCFFNGRGMEQMAGGGGGGGLNQNIYTGLASSISTPPPPPHTHTHKVFLRKVHERSLGCFWRGRGGGGSLTRVKE